MNRKKINSSIERSFFRKNLLCAKRSENWNSKCGKKQTKKCMLRKNIISILFVKKNPCAQIKSEKVKKEKYLRALTIGKRAARN